MKSASINLAAFGAWALFWIGYAHADIRPNSLFADHAVLQRGKPLPIWGTGTEGEEVKVTLGEESVSTSVRNGKWRVILNSRPAGGPHTLLIQGVNRIELKDILVGDVWVVAGQSNMERQLGPRRGQKDIENWQAEVTAANHPQIREFNIPAVFDLAPSPDCDGRWRVCSPESVADFSAVGYFFSRDLHSQVKVPIGILFAALGGTVAEAWASYSALAELPDFQKAAIAQSEFVAEYPGCTPEQAWEQWYVKNDPGSKPDQSWIQKPSATDIPGTWQPISVPGPWGKLVLPDFDGVVWFRKVVDLPATWSDNQVIPILNLGRIREADTTWINGVYCGGRAWSLNRTYRVPPKTLVPGRNVITVRVICPNRAFEAGFLGKADEIKFTNGDGNPLPSIPLAGDWEYRLGTPMAGTVKCPGIWYVHKNLPAVLYNKMIAPLTSYPIKGVAWYQGEQNVARASQYRELFPRLIADWRAVWNQGEFPFLFVQIAPYKTMTPELREAQLLTLERVPNTAMVVTVDCGDADDIHPVRKQPVGARLALAARALAYGEQIEYSGPLFKKAEFKADRAIVHFSHIGGGLTSKDGSLRGFTLAGADMNFVPAMAGIEGDTVIVRAEGITKPAAVRYGWENVPDVNLFNWEGLPASPFRSDSR